MAGIALTSDFPQLPGDNDSDRIEVYGIVYAQLTAMGLPHPGTPPALIKRANMLNWLQTQAGLLVHLELAKARYQGHTDAECAAALNKADVLGAFTASPLHGTLIAFPFAPNSLTADDVTHCR